MFLFVFTFMIFDPQTRHKVLVRDLKSIWKCYLRVPWDRQKPKSENADMPYLYTEFSITLFVSLVHSIPFLSVLSATRAPAIPHVFSFFWGILRYLPQHWLDSSDSLFKKSSLAPYQLVVLQIFDHNSLCIAHTSLQWSVEICLSHQRVSSLSGSWFLSLEVQRSIQGARVTLVHVFIPSV